MIQTKEQHIEVEGIVTVVLPGTLFRVELANKHVVLATICGKMRKRWVRLTVGDHVKMEMSSYDLDKARITWRLRNIAPLAKWWARTTAAPDDRVRASNSFIRSAIRAAFHIGSCGADRSFPSHSRMRWQAS